MSEVVGVASRSHSDMFMIVLRGYISRSRDRNLDGFGSGHGPPQLCITSRECDETPSGTRYKRYGRFQRFHSVGMGTSDS